MSSKPEGLSPSTHQPLPRPPALRETAQSPGSAAICWQTLELRVREKAQG